jgi:hypothetical protein
VREKLQSWTKCALNVVIAAHGKSELHREALQCSGMRNENPAWNRDGGVFIQLHRENSYPEPPERWRSVAVSGDEILLRALPQMNSALL